MRITRIETVRVQAYPNLLWVQIHTDDRLIGLGETYYQPAAVEAIIHDFAAPMLLGQSAFDRERHWQSMFCWANFFGYAGAEMRAISAIDIALWDLFGQHTGQPVYNRGFGGSEIADSTHFAPRIVFPYAPRMIVFRAGGNDLWAGKKLEQVFADFQEFVAIVHAKLPETEIVFISWNPTPARWKQHEQEKELNRLVENFTRQTPHVKYIETYDLSLGADGQPRPELFVADQLHFNAAGYKLLADRVRPVFSK